MTAPTANFDTVVATAINSLGAVEDDGTFPAKVASRVADITLAMSEGSDAYKVFAGMTGAAGNKTKSVHGWLADVEFERKTNRAVFVLKTRPHPKHNKDGIDRARTERLESPYAVALAKKAKEIIGHNVTIYLELQPFEDSDGDAKYSRVVWNIVDRGEAKEPTYN